MSAGNSWQLEIAPSARRDIKRLGHQVQARIIEALEGLRAEPAQGDIRRLNGIQPPEWRLRVGDWRIRFARNSETRTEIILRALPRGRAYRD